MDGKFREWRDGQGFSQQEVADLTGVSKPLISRIERGLRIPSAKTKARIARRLGVRIAELFSPAGP